MGTLFVPVAVLSSLFLSLVSAQFGNIPFANFGSSFFANSNTNGIRVPSFSGSGFPGNRVTYSQNTNIGEKPSFEILYPSGLGIKIPVPPGWTDHLDVLVDVRLTINEPFEENNLTGKYNIKGRGGKGLPYWRFEIPDISVHHRDTIYYYVKLSEGELPYDHKFYDFLGFDQIPDENPYGGNYRPVVIPVLSTGHLPVPPAGPISVPGSVFGSVPGTLQGSIPNRETASTPGIQALMSPDRNEIPPKNQRGCVISQTTYNNGMKACQKEYFATTFEFKTEERLGNEDPEESVVMFSMDNFVEDSAASIFKVSPLATQYDPNGKDGSISLPRCTASESKLCSASATGFLILPPVIAARKTTKDTLTFRYGELEITAKFPSGDWIVPELWLVPKNPHRGNKEKPTRIIVAMARGNSQLSNGTHDLSNKVLEAGIQSEAGDQMFRLESQRPWSDDYHNYRMRWTPDEIMFGVDNKELGTVRIGGSFIPLFNQEFYVTLGLHVGGNTDFPDSISGKPWKNFDVKERLKFWKAQSSWLPTWDQNSVLAVKKVALRAL